MSLSKLPATHRRGVHASLKLMEQRLDEVTRWLNEGAVSGGTVERVDDLAPEVKTEALVRISALRERVLEAVADLGLPPERLELSRLCLGTLGLTWELAPDLRPNKMTGYGKVPELLAPELRRLADELEQPLLDLLRLLESERRG